MGGSDTGAMPGVLYTHLFTCRPARQPLQHVFDQVTELSRAGRQVNKRVT